MKALKPFFLITDIGFILYWILTGFHWIPKNWAFKDYGHPLIIAWNWSFLPLDLLISFTGLWSLYLQQKGKREWAAFALVSLVSTFCSGLQAIAFWAFRRDFDPVWWVFNLYLLIYPLFFIRRFLTLREEPETG